ncbi:MAG: NAD(P)H-dependent oxidoreductase [Bacteroidetes bacterium]|nr:NAD(P)H-dependent oxidoreductase [Bacteroidota bacterium]MBI3481740.1 NAD(P)H-dependent oxidoreductase [Bacteroidota bacterium]
MTKKKILAICGSTRKTSSNLNLINAIVDLTKEKFDVTIFNGLAVIPHFNPDLDNETPPEIVDSFRKQLKEVDGILICTPEYAMGVPGTLKNAIDWTVSSCEFSHKPVALITASSLGENAHESLLMTLKIIESNITEQTQLIISYVKTKVSRDNKITDNPTLEQVSSLINSFDELINETKTAPIQG